MSKILESQYSPATTMMHASAFHQKILAWSCFPLGEMSKLHPLDTEYQEYLNRQQPYWRSVEYNFQSEFFKRLQSADDFASLTYKDIDDIAYEAVHNLTQPNYEGDDRVSMGRYAEAELVRSNFKTITDTICKHLSSWNTNVARILFPGTVYGVKPELGTHRFGYRSIIWDFSISRQNTSKPEKFTMDLLWSCDSVPEFEGDWYPIKEYFLALVHPDENRIETWAKDAFLSLSKRWSEQIKDEDFQTWMTKQNATQTSITKDLHDHFRSHYQEYCWDFSPAAQAKAMGTWTSRVIDNQLIFGLALRPWDFFQGGLGRQVTANRSGFPLCGSVVRYLN